MARAWGKSLIRLDGVEVWIGDRMYFFEHADRDAASVRQCEMLAGKLENERLKEQPVQGGDYEAK